MKVDMDMFAGKEKEEAITCIIQRQVGSLGEVAPR
jgi:hypothetical protein